MGLLGKIGHGIKAVGHAVGGVAEKAAPFVGLIPGVGTLAAAGIGGAGALLHGDGLKGAIRYGAEGALGDIGQHFAQKIPGVGKYFDTDKLLGGVGNYLHGGGGLPNRPPPIEGALPPGGYNAVLPPAGGGGGGGGHGGVIDWLKKGGQSGQQGGAGGVPNWQKLLGLGLGGVGVLKNAQADTKNNALTDEQVARAREAAARQKMIQDQILASIGKPGASFQPVAAPDYSALFGQTQNPFYKPAQAGG